MTYFLQSLSNDICEQRNFVIWIMLFFEISFLSLIVSAFNIPQRYTSMIFLILSSVIFFRLPLFHIHLNKFLIRQISILASIFLFFGDFNLSFEFSFKFLPSKLIVCKIITSSNSSTNFIAKLTKTCWPKYCLKIRLCSFVIKILSILNRNLV